MDTSSFRKDLKQLIKPYYWINILLSLSYLIGKRTPVCYIFRSKKDDDFCELDGRETEILFFLVIVIMIRTRKTGSVTMINYLNASFMYTKIANLILWSYYDTVYGIIFAIICVLVGVIFPEPTYSGPEHIVYFRNSTGLEEEMAKNKNAIWLVCFFTVWSPSCVNFAPIFASLLAEYHLNGLNFGKIDVGRFPDAGKKYGISNSSLSGQLPTVILFKNGKEVDRRPLIDNRGKLQRFFFSQDNVRAAFGLNILHDECKKNATNKDSKSIKQLKKTE